MMLIQNFMSTKTGERGSHITGQHIHINPIECVRNFSNIILTAYITAHAQPAFFASAEFVGFESSVAFGEISGVCFCS